MKRYCIDANLPYYLRIWKTPEYIHVFDLNDTWTDSEIWEYARTNTLTIVTKDTDFSHRMIVSIPPPRVIHLRVGNMRIQDFHQFLTTSWQEICAISATHKLVCVFTDRIESVE
jgi:predicted nuclease of predicted toxin-antitoxin system